MSDVFNVDPDHSLAPALRREVKNLADAGVDRCAVLGQLLESVDPVHGLVTEEHALGAFPAPDDYPRGGYTWSYATDPREWLREHDEYCKRIGDL